jgi:hypothetical protein
MTSIRIFHESFAAMDKDVGLKVDYTCFSHCLFTIKYVSKLNISPIVSDETRNWTLMGAVAF